MCSTSWACNSLLWVQPCLLLFCFLYRFFCFFAVYKGTRLHVGSRMTLICLFLLHFVSLAPFCCLRIFGSLRYLLENIDTVMVLRMARHTVIDFSAPAAKANRLRKLYRYVYLIYSFNRLIRPSIHSSYFIHLGAIHPPRINPSINPSILRSFNPLILQSFNLSIYRSINLLIY